MFCADEVALTDTACDIIRPRAGVDAHAVVAARKADIRAARDGAEAALGRPAARELRGTETHGVNESSVSLSK